MMFSQFFYAALFAVLSLTVLVGLAIAVETATAKLCHRRLDEADRRGHRAGTVTSTPSHHAVAADAP